MLSCAVSSLHFGFPISLVTYFNCLVFNLQTIYHDVAWQHFERPANSLTCDEAAEKPNENIYRQMGQPKGTGGRELCKGEKQQTTREREHLKIYEQRPQSSALCGMPKRNKRAFIMPHGAGAAANPACVCMVVPLCVSCKQTNAQTNEPSARRLKIPIPIPGHQNSTNSVFFFHPSVVVHSNTRRMRNICIEPS